MWVPVRSRSSRKNSTSSKRGSTSREYSLPFTLTRMEVLEIPSGIKMTYLHLLATRATYGGCNRALDQRPHELALVFGGASHIGLRISGHASRFRCRHNCFFGNSLAPKCALCLVGPHRHKGDAAQSNRSCLARVALHTQLYRDAGGGINGSGPLEGNIRAAAAFWRRLNGDFTHQLIVAKRGRVRIFHKITKPDNALAVAAETSNIRREGHQYRGPVAAGIRLGERAADRAPIPDLHISDSRRAIAKDGDFRRRN